MVEEVTYVHLKHNPEQMSAYVRERLHAASAERTPLVEFGVWEGPIEAINSQIVPILENLENVLRLLGFGIGREVSIDEIKANRFFKSMHDKYKGEFIRFIQSIYTQLEIIRVIGDSIRDAIEAACNDVFTAYVVNRAAEVIIDELNIGRYGKGKHDIREECINEYIEIYKNRRILSYLLSLRAVLVDSLGVDKDRLGSIQGWQRQVETKIWDYEGVNPLHSDMNIYGQLFEFYNFLGRLNRNISSIRAFGHGLGNKMIARGTSNFRELVGTLNEYEEKLTREINELIPRLGELLSKLSKTLFFLRQQTMTITLAEFQELHCTCLPIIKDGKQFLFGVPLSIADPLYGVRFGEPTVIFVGENGDLLCFPDPFYFPILIPDNAVIRLRDGQEILVIDVQHRVVKPRRPRIG